MHTAGVHSFTIKMSLGTWPEARITYVWYCAVILYKSWCMLSVTEDACPCVLHYKMQELTVFSFVETILSSPSVFSVSPVPQAPTRVVDTDHQGEYIWAAPQLLLCIGCCRGGGGGR